jgi:putative heme-binding domain-containing protein
MLLWVALLLFQQGTLDMPGAETNPYTSPADIALGTKLYLGRCAGCHGPAGDGGKGTNLASPSLPRGQTDRSLYRTIRYGLSDTEMPGHNMTEREIWQMAAFVRTLGRANGERVSGDPGRGAAIVRGKGGCFACHILNGEGGLSGPPLTGIGERRSPSYFRAKLLDPGRDLSADFTQVRLVTSTGQRVNGIRLNEDIWSIQVRDMNGGLHSYWKEDLAEFSTQRRTLMPSYEGRLSPDEVRDVAAFLGAQRGAGSQ